MADVSKRLDVFMQDIIPLYKDFVELLRIGEDVTIEKFETLFDRHQLEYLHYCGSSTSTPFLVDVETDILQLSAAYLSFPKEALLPHVPLFSLLLLYFLYGTQPLLDNLQLPPMRIKLSIDAYELIFAHPPSSGIATEESPLPPLKEYLALSLYAHNAFSLQPCANHQLYVDAVIRAHQIYGAPIFMDKVYKSSGSRVNRYPITSSCSTAEERIQCVKDTQLRSSILDYMSKREKNREVFRTKIN